MKKVVSICLSLFLIFSMSLSVFASVPEADPYTLIYDYAWLIPDEAEAELRDKMRYMVETHDMDIAVVVTDDNAGLSSADYADDFYDFNGFGDDGLLMLINMEDREVWISTYGRGADYFTDFIIDEMTYELVDPLGEGDFVGAVQLFLYQVEEILQQPPEGQTSSTAPESSPVRPTDQRPGQSSEYQERSIISLILPAALGSAVFGGIVVAVMAFLHNKLPNKSQTTFHYVSDGRIHLRVNRDIFLHSSVRKTAISQNDGGSRSGGSSRGHSTMHRSSSGRSHGGGGRKF